jgi:hypothetical protein
VPQRQLPFAYGLGGIEKRFVDVPGGQVRMLSEDVVGRHSVSDHRHHRCDREAQPSDAWQASHDIGVRRDAFVGHESMLAVADVYGMIVNPHTPRASEHYLVGPETSSTRATLTKRPGHDMWAVLDLNQ